MNNEDIAEKLKSKYKKLTNDELSLALGTWITEENQKKGYLPGLSPSHNIENLTQMVEQCNACENQDGHCDISNMLRNMATTEVLLKFWGDRSEKDMNIIIDGYDKYAMLHEHTSRVCAGTWYDNLYTSKPTICSVEQKGLV